MKFYYLKHSVAFAIALGTPNMLRASALEAQEPQQRLRRHLQGGGNGGGNGDTEGGGGENGPQIRFSEKISFENPSPRLEVVISNFFPLSEDDFPMSQDLADVLQSSNCVSVMLPDDYECSQSVAEMVELVGGTPTHAPRRDFWPLFREVVSYQIQRRRDGEMDAMDVMPWLNLPELWQGLTLNEVGEAVHDEFPGYHQMNLLTSLLGQGLEIDNDLIPKRSEKQFLHGPVLFANLNTWSVDMVGPTNFGAKYFAGRARPEEVAWAITCSQEGFVNTAGCETAFQFDLPTVPTDIVQAIVGMNLQRMEDFCQYSEGAPPHPSWPAMHSASSNISLWLAVVAKLTPEQALEAKKTDLAVAMGRTVAGVHYKDDNTAGLTMGQEIMARELPQYLASKYGADAIKVKAKIASLRFDWRLTMEELLA